MILTQYFILDRNYCLVEVSTTVFYFERAIFLLKFLLQSFTLFRTYYRVEGSAKLFYFISNVFPVEFFKTS